MENYREKNNKSLVLIALIVLILIFVFFNSVIKDIITVKLFKRNKDFNEINSFKINTESKIDVEVNEDVILICHNSGIYCIDNDGNEKWSKHVEDTKYNLAMNNDVFYMTDENKESITAYNIDGDKIWNYELDRIINNIFMENNYLEVVSHDKENNEYIDIFNKNGTLFFSNSIRDGKFIKAYVNDKLEEIILNTLHFSPNGIMSIMSIYNIGNELITQKKFENEIIYAIDYINENELLVVTDNNIFIIKDDKILWSEVVKDIKDFTIDNERNIFILENKLVRCFSNSGDEIFKKKVSKDMKILGVNNDILIVCGDKNFTIYDKSGKSLTEYINSDVIHDIILKDNKIIVITDDGIKELEFIDKII